jgi:hypothetical protein
MSRLANLASSIDDRFNPVMVRELRQVSRGKLLVGMLTLFLIIALLIVTTMIDQERRWPDRSGTNGAVLVTSITILLGFITHLIIPLSFCWKMVQERREERLDLLYVTAMSPGAVIRGKLTAAAVMIGFFVITALPLASFGFFLGGVDLRDVTFSMMVHFSTALALTSLLIALACILPRQLLIALIAVVGLMLLQLVFGLMRAFSATSSSGTDLLTTTIGPIGLALAATGGFAVLSTAAITSERANRALPVRIYFTAAWLVIWTIGFFLIKNSDFTKLWAVAGLVIGIFGYVAAIRERELPGRRLQNTIPRNPVLRLAAFPFFSGSVNGIVWATGMCALATLAFALSREEPAYFVAITCYALAYCMTAQGIYKTLFQHMPRGAVWSLLILMAVLFLLAPILIIVVTGADFDRGREIANYVHLVSPLSLTNDNTKESALLISIAWALIASLAQVSWMIRGILAFKPAAEEEAIP